MACGADLYLQVLAEGGPGAEFVTAATGYFDLAVLWVNIGFHGTVFWKRRVSILLRTLDDKMVRRRWLGPECESPLNTRIQKEKETLSTDPVNNSVEEGTNFGPHPGCPQRFS